MKSLDELNAIKDKYASDVTIRTSDYEVRIIVGMGNSGLVSGARDILKTIVKRVEDEGLSGKVIVTQEARVSKVGHNPVVKIVEDGVKTAVYANVTSEMAQRIIDEHIMNGKIIDEYLLKEEQMEEDKV
ncbi:MAG: (2Fe-2S) ferredoxin domain-containing protein [Clostridium sp.]|nr:(2Fe-2S) ferredoxin domain-containing protein [Clostridium sp.]